MSGGGQGSRPCAAAAAAAAAYRAARSARRSWPGLRRAEQSGCAGPSWPARGTHQSQLGRPTCASGARLVCAANGPARTHSHSLTRPQALPLNGRPAAKCERRLMGQRSRLNVDETIKRSQEGRYIYIYVYSNELQHTLTRRRLAHLMSAPSSRRRRRRRAGIQSPAGGSVGPLETDD